MTFQSDMKKTKRRVGYGSSCLGSLIYPFLRVGFGCEYFGAQAFFGLLALWIFSAQASPRELIPCLVFTVLHIVARCYHRYRFLASDWGRHCSSHYSGYPRVCLRSSMSERTGKLIVEPLVAASISFLMMCFISESLGLFLLACCVAAFFEQVSDMQEASLQVRALRDADLYHQSIFEEYEREYGDQ